MSIGKRKSSQPVTLEQLGIYLGEGNTVLPISHIFHKKCTLDYQRSKHKN